MLSSLILIFFDKTLARHKAFNVRLHPVALGSKESQLELRIPRLPSCPHQMQQPLEHRSYQEYSL